MHSRFPQTFTAGHKYKYRTKCFWKGIMVSSWYFLFFSFIVLFLYKNIVQDRAHCFYNTCICLFFWTTCVYNGSDEKLQVVVIFYFGDCQFFFSSQGHWQGYSGPILDYIAVVTGSFTARLIDLAILLGGCLDWTASYVIQLAIKVSQKHPLWPILIELWYENKLSFARLFSLNNIMVGRDFSSL